MSAPVSASSFSNLLRRSKFSSYDPAINQVYTSFGGYAHRGHWGTKRDLPSKRKHKVSDPLVSSSGSRGSSRRNPVAFISSLDSAEGQTEWSSAEKDVRWLRRLEELGSGTHLYESSAWNKRVGGSRGRATGAIDSEFDTVDSAQKIGQQTTSALPNTQAMSERRFRSYISQLRGQRQAFHEFLQDIGVGQPEDRTGTPQVVPMYHFARGPSSFHTRFLTYTNQKAAVQPTSHTLTPVPHPSAGLDYLNPSPLLTQLLYPSPVKGRYVEGTSRLPRYPDKFENSSIVSLAGYNAILSSNTGSAAGQPIDWHRLIERDFSQPVDRTTSEYRVEKLEIQNVPRVVGQSRQNIEGAVIKIHARDWSKNAEEQPNPHRPGSFEYVSHEDNRTVDHQPVSMKSRVIAPMQQTQQASRNHASTTIMMDLLDSLLQPGTKDKKN